MIRIHKEGRATLLIAGVVLCIVNLLLCQLFDLPAWLIAGFVLISVAFYLFLISFFRNPIRHTLADANAVIAPADGKVVVIEETTEGEYLKDKRIQVSIFMSPFNVHVNRYPVSGQVTFCKYHPGLYLVAWHPKSSTENERTTVVIETSSKTQILLRQIAGALARRIVCYPQQGWMVKQGEEMGFIKFGSRVDVFLPLNAKIKVNMDQKVKGGETILAELS